MTRANAGGEASLKFGGESKAYSKHHRLESRNNISSVDRARRGALVRQVPPVEEPAESAAKKHQCNRSHRSNEREECATRAPAEEGDSLEWSRRLYDPSLKKDSWSELRRFLKEGCRAHRPDASDRERCRRAPMRRRHRSEERCENRYCQGTRENLNYERPPRG